MSDPDVFALLDEIIEECHLIRKSDALLGDALPLHYALLSHAAWRPAFVRHLRDDYRIASLPVPNGPDNKPDLVPLLRMLSGAVAQRTQPLLREFSPIFDKQTAEKRLSEIIQCTGSDRADIVLEGHGRDLKHWFHWDWHLPGREHDPTKQSSWRDDPPQAGVMSAAYLEPVAFQYAPRLPNAGSVAANTESQSTMSSVLGNYFPWDDHSRSELAVPIMARGLRIGVLNIESYFAGAYSRGHLAFLQKQAELIGALRLEAEERDRSIRKVEKIARPGPSGVAVLIEKLRKMYPGASSLEGIFYTPTFASGTLRGYFKDTEKSVDHRPYENHRSFASNVFRTRAGCFEPDVKRAIKDGRIDLSLANAVGLREGPLYGFQVFDHELMCGVSVLWARQNGSADTSRYGGLNRPELRMVLATGANLLVTAHKWNGNLEWESLDQVLEHINALHSASSELQIFEHAAHAVVALGLKRLRVWQINYDDQLAEIRYAWPPSYLVSGVTETWIRSLKHTGDEQSATFSEYSRRVYTRYETDPWARLQGPSVSGLGEDPVSDKVQRPLGTDWIIAPVVIGIGDPTLNRPKLWGYLSADKVSETVESDASSDTGKFDYRDEDERNWMECGMSVVAVGLSSALTKAPFSIGSRSFSASGF